MSVWATEITGDVRPYVRLCARVIHTQSNANNNFTKTPPFVHTRLSTQGDPGLGKSQMLRAAAAAAPRSVYVCGNVVTSTGAFCLAD